MTNILEERLGEAEGSLGRLNDAITTLKEYSGDDRLVTQLFDGLVKRFEDAFITTVDVLKAGLTKEGLEALSPRGAIQEAVRLGWVTDPDFWLIALDARSVSVSGASDLKGHEYQNIITQFATEAEVIVNLLYELRK